MSISQLLSSFICRELRGAGEKTSSALPLVDSPFQSNLTESKLDETKTKTQTFLLISPPCWEFTVQRWEGPEIPTKSLASFTGKQDLGHWPSHSVGGTETSMPNHQWQSSSLTFRRSFGLKVSPNHSLPQRLRKKAKICLDI